MGRAAVTKEDMLLEIDNLRHMVSGEFDADLVINVDESGFCQRLFEEPQKNCVFIHTEETRPRFFEVPDENRASIVAAITLSGRHLLPLLLSTRSILPEEIQASYLFHEFLFCHTSMGYLTAEAMDCWVDSGLIPYVTWARAVIGHHTAALLILDGLKTHFTSHVSEVFELEAVALIILPAQASHLYQVPTCGVSVSQERATNSREATAPSHFTGRN
jgi:hypothetical protein